MSTYMIRRAAREWVRWFGILATLGLVIATAIMLVQLFVLPSGS